MAGNQFEFGESQLGDPTDGSLAYLRYHDGGFIAGSSDGLELPTASRTPIEALENLSAAKREIEENKRRPYDWHALGVLEEVEFDDHDLDPEFDPEDYESDDPYDNPDFPG